jgi:hypothetical protein
VKIILSIIEVIDSSGLWTHLDLLF